jgi:hypothetical protein
LDIGQLTDDWSDLVGLLENDEDRIPSKFDFLDLATILRSIGDLSDLS